MKAAPKKLALLLMLSVPSIAIGFARTKSPDEVRVPTSSDSRTTTRREPRRWEPIDHDVASKAQELPAEVRKTLSPKTDGTAECKFNPSCFGRFCDSVKKIAVSVWEGIARFFGRTAAAVAKAAAGSLGFVETSRSPPRDKKCAQQTGNILKAAGIQGIQDDAVVGFHDKAKAKGWCEGKTAIPGALVYANEKFGNGPRSHIGVISIPTPDIEPKAREAFSRMGEAGKRYHYVDPRTNSRVQLTIYHNEVGTMIGYPRKDMDVNWARKAKFLYPPEMCRR